MILLRAPFRSHGWCATKSCSVALATLKMQVRKQPGASRASYFRELEAMNTEQQSPPPATDFI